VGRDFCDFVSGVSNVHVHIFKAIREAQALFADRHRDETFHERLIRNRLDIAASLRTKFDLTKEEDFWETLFNNAFESDAPEPPPALALPAPGPLASLALSAADPLTALDAPAPAAKARRRPRKP
jgi:hypothetical protein